MASVGAVDRQIKVFIFTPVMGSHPSTLDSNTLVTPGMIGEISAFTRKAKSVLDLTQAFQVHRLSSLTEKNFRR